MRQDFEGWADGVVGLEGRGEFVIVIEGRSGGEQGRREEMKRRGYECCKRSEEKNKGKG